MRATTNCLNPKCGKAFETTEYRLRIGESKYCSKPCKNAMFIPRKYTPKVVQWVKENIGKMTGVQMAKELGITPGAFRTTIKNYGVSFSKNRPKNPKKKRVYAKVVSKPALPTQQRPKQSRRTVDDLPNLLRLKGTKAIYIAENERVKVSIRVSDKKIVMVYPEQVEQTKLKYGIAI